MKLAVFAFTQHGCSVAKQVKACFAAEETRFITMEKFGQPDALPYRPPLADCMGTVFPWADLIVFIGSTGMAVRGLAPWVQHKTHDPAVLVVDEQGTFVISLLSGHIGGANGYAQQLSTALGAVCVITTATDVNRRFSVDAWAAKNGLWIDDMTVCKHVSAAILEGDIPVTSDFPLPETLPKGLKHGNSGEIGVYIGYRRVSPFKETLHLVPKAVRLGIGCRRGISSQAVAQAVDKVVESCGIYPQSLCRAASIDLKKDEAGLLEFCKKRGLDIDFYPAEVLKEVPGSYPQSAFVQRITGVDNVCQRAAMLGASKLVSEKQAVDGVTVALAEIKWEAVL